MTTENITRDDPGLFDPDRPRHCRLGMAKYPPWISAPDDHGAELEDK